MFTIIKFLLFIIIIILLLLLIILSWLLSLLLVLLLLLLLLNEINIDKPKYTVWTMNVNLKQHLGFPS